MNSIADFSLVLSCANIFLFIELIVKSMCSIDLQVPVKCTQDVQKPNIFPKNYLNIPVSIRYANAHNFFRFFSSVSKLILLRFTITITSYRFKFIYLKIEHFHIHIFLYDEFMEAVCALGKNNNKCKIKRKIICQFCCIFFKRKKK